MTPQEIMARHIIETLAAGDMTVSPSQMLGIATKSGQPAQFFGLAVGQLQAMRAVKPTTAGDALFLSTKGERIADYFRGLNPVQTRQLEQDAALGMLQAVAFGTHPGSVKPQHVGRARRDGIISSLTEHQYVEHVNQGAAYRLTLRGKEAVQKLTPTA